MKVLLIINPMSRTGQLIKDKLIMGLRQNHHEILNENTGIDPNEIILKYKDEANVVIVAGGDGSVNLVLPSLKQTHLPLLVVPCGTANNLARHYSLTNDVEQSILLLTDGKIVDIDLGEVNNIPFVNVAGLGLSTEVNRKVSSKVKKHLGAFAFILTAIQLATKMNPFRAIITTDKKIAMPTKSWQISVCNGKHYGAGMVIKHNATLSDGKLHMLSTEVTRWWKAINLVRSFFTGRYSSDQAVKLMSAKEIRIDTRRKFHVDVDGDIKTMTPATFKVIPKAIRLIIPEAIS